mmetsp:Transcript_21459/g.44126  ORF Transcript_21459/g.44126 Transcript_21459/m.44126 type:complete len:84 (-) Transcript_21459:348-599(-)
MDTMAELMGHSPGYVRPRKHLLVVFGAPQPQMNGMVFFVSSNHGGLVVSQDVVAHFPAFQFPASSRRNGGVIETVPAATKLAD